MLEFDTSDWEWAEIESSPLYSSNAIPPESLESNILKAIFLFNRERLRDSMELMLPVSWLEQEEQSQALAELNSLKAVDVDLLLGRIESDLEEQQNIRFKLDEPDSDYRAKLADKNKKYLTSILDGNQSVFLKFYEMEFPAIVRMILRYGGTVEDAKDLFQDALIVIVEKSIHAELDLSCTLGTYLYSICRNKWMNHLRKYQHLVSYKESLDHSSDEMKVWDTDPTDDKKQENAIQIIENLGMKCKMLLNYYYYRKMSWEEISVQLGYASAASARNQKYKCLERIKYQLQNGS